MSVSDKREEVFSIARKIAREEGLSALTIRRLANDSSISVGSIYNIFGTKDNLVMMLIEDYWTSSIKNIIKDMENEKGSLVDNIEYIYKSFKSTSSQFHDDWIRDMVGMNMSNPDILDQSNKYKSILEAKIAELIREDSLDKTFNEDFTAEDISSFIFENLMILLRNEEEDLGFFRFVLEKIFEVN